MFWCYARAISSTTSVEFPTSTIFIVLLAPPLETPGSAAASDPLSCMTVSAQAVTTRVSTDHWFFAWFLVVMTKNIDLLLWIWIVQSFPANFVPVMYTDCSELLK